MYRQIMTLIAPFYLTVLMPDIPTLSQKETPEKNTIIKLHFRAVVWCPQREESFEII